MRTSGSEIDETSALGTGSGAGGFVDADAETEVEGAALGGADAVTDGAADVLAVATGGFVTGLGFGVPVQESAKMTNEHTLRATRSRILAR